MTIQQKCISAYRKHKHLKMAASDVGIPWQTVYVHLRAAGEPVTGDKLQYGSKKDRLAAKAEQLFLSLVPYARDMNAERFQAKYDFDVRGQKVEIKVARPALSSRGTKLKRYAFSLKRQESVADFFVCFCWGGALRNKALLVPGEIARHYHTISLPERGGKWLDYAVELVEIEPFFSSFVQIPQHEKGLLA